MTAGQGSYKLPNDSACPSGGIRLCYERISASSPAQAVILSATPRNCSAPDIPGAQRRYRGNVKVLFRQKRKKRSHYA